LNDYILWLNQLGMADLDRVGGKNASLGEMISQLSGAGVHVPCGFATTSAAFKAFLAHDQLADRIYQRLADLDVDDIQALRSAGEQIRSWVMNTPLPQALQSAISEAWQTMTAELGEAVSVAVRSSATAEDLPEASFAGQQETFLNVSGLENVITRVHEVYASLYNDRAIAYRVHQGFEHEVVLLSVGVQQMVRSDLAASGVMFTLDTESGFDRVVLITSAWGLGETVVQGSVNPDEFYVYKPSISSGHHAVVRKTIGSKLSKMIHSDDGRGVQTIETSESERQQFSISDHDIQDLARQAMIIETHYGRPMDIEWAKDGVSGQIYIVQARPETVKSRSAKGVIERFKLKQRGPVLTEGRSIGQRIGAGRTRVIRSVAEMDRVKPGDVLVTGMTDPDWEPVMKRAAAIVTDRGGRTCHAAIIARELGIPAVVGCGDATQLIADGIEVTVSCAEGDTGFIYAGLLDFEVQTSDIEQMPEMDLKVMMNVGNPDRAFDFALLPNRGIGLARLEFIINRMIGVHPRALLNLEAQPADVRSRIDEQMAGYADPVTFYVEKLAEGIATLACSVDPEPIIVRTSDFKSNEYANLIGGQQYEPEEENPMLGFRGAARYIDPSFRPCFELECKALKRVREVMGLKNVWVMIPFVRTLDEARQCIDLLAENGLKSGEDGLKIIMMCELPSNALLADQFLEYFDGFSIGSNDLTQLTLGLDRDSGLIAHLFDERDPAIKLLLEMAIKACRRQGKYIGICGQGPSDHPDLAEWLMAHGIESVSLNPDTIVPTWHRLAAAQSKD